MKCGKRIRYCHADHLRPLTAEIPEEKPDHVEIELPNKISNRQIVCDPSPVKENEHSPKPITSEQPKSSQELGPPEPVVTPKQPE